MSYVARRARRCGHRDCGGDPRGARAGRRCVRGGRRVHLRVPQAPVERVRLVLLLSLPTRPHVRITQAALESLRASRGQTVHYPYNTILYCTVRVQYWVNEPFVYPILVITIQICREPRAERAERRQQRQVEAAGGSAAAAGEGARGRPGGREPGLRPVYGDARGRAADAAEALYASGRPGNLLFSRVHCAPAPPRALFVLHLFERMFSSAYCTFRAFRSRAKLCSHLLTM